VIPIDTATGQQSGSEAHSDRTPVLKGWLVTHADGTEARLGPDKGRADVYMRTHRGVAIEAMFVWREAGEGR
jgi:hypothetical protein